MSNKTHKKKKLQVRRIEGVQERTRNMTFRIDMAEKDIRLYTGMALAGYLVFLAGIGLYIHRMFTLHLGDLRYAVMVVGLAMAAALLTGFIEVFREMSQKTDVLKSEQISKGRDRVTNIAMACGQIFLAVFLMEILSRSSMPRWIPMVAAAGALICYSGGKQVSEAVKAIGAPEAKKPAKGKAPATAKKRPPKKTQAAKKEEATEIEKPVTEVTATEMPEVDTPIVDTPEAETSA